MKHIYLLSGLVCISLTLFGANDKYRLIITGDPSNSITIGWNQVSGHSVAVFYDTIDHGLDVASYANFQLPDRTVAFKGMNNHFVHLTALKQQCAYYFIIVDSEGTSERFWFRTLSNDPTVPLSIVAGGDSRRSGAETTPHEPRIQSNDIVRTLRPDLVAFGGDYTDKDTDGQWITWMDDWQFTTGDDGLMIPILPTRGNHERNNEVMLNLFDVQYNDIYYATNLGGSLIRFYTLNVMISVAGAQSTWLAEDLAANESATAWKMAQYHYSIAPHHSGKSFQTPMYIHWSSLFHQYGMHLVVECDAHVAKNTFPIIPTEEAGQDQGFIRDDETGTVYTGEGSWGLIRNADQGYEWTRERGGFTQVKWMHVTQDSIVMFTIKSATSQPQTPVSDDDRFTMPEGLDIWTTEHGDRLVIDRPNPLYNPVTNTTQTLEAAEGMIELIYPVPASDFIYLKTRETNLTYEIYNMQGQLMDYVQSNTLTPQINIRHMPAGTYLLKATKVGTSISEVKTFIKD